MRAHKHVSEEKKVSTDINFSYVFITILRAHKHTNINAKIEAKKKRERIIGKTLIDFRIKNKLKRSVNNIDYLHEFKIIYYCLKLLNAFTALMECSQSQQCTAGLLATQTNNAVMLQSQDACRTLAANEHFGDVILMHVLFLLMFECGFCKYPCYFYQNTTQ